MRNTFTVIVVNICDFKRVSVSKELIYTIFQLLIINTFTYIYV